MPTPSRSRRRARSAARRLRAWATVAAAAAAATAGAIGKAAVADAAVLPAAPASGPAPSPPWVSFPLLSLTFDERTGGVASAAPNSTAQGWFTGQASRGGGAGGKGQGSTGGGRRPGGVEGSPPAWRLTFLSGASLDSTQCRAGPTFDGGGAGNNITVHWIGCEAPGGSELAVSVVWAPANLPPAGLNFSRSPPAAPFGAAGSIRVTSVGPLSAAVPPLADVTWPILWLRPGRPMAGANATLVWSREAGRSWRDPWADDAPTGFLTGTQSAAFSGPTQFGLVVDDDERALYWATHDPGLHNKHFQYVNNKTNAALSGEAQPAPAPRPPPESVQMARSNGVVEVAVRHVCPSATLASAPLDFSPPYPVVLTTFRGGWWDGAKLYREWAVGQRWVPPRHAAPAPGGNGGGGNGWLQDTHVWARGDTKTAGSVNATVETLLQYAKLFGTPLGVQLYDWANETLFPTNVTRADDPSCAVCPASVAKGGVCCASGWMVPSRWPPKPEWPAAFARLKAAGVRVLPYVNSLGDNTVDANWAADRGNEGAIRAPDGSVASYGPSEPTAVEMCAAVASFRSRVANTSLRLQREGASGVYMDQSGNQMTTPCFAQAHGHTLGGGTYGADGVRAMFAAARSELRRADPEAVLAGEVPPEGLLDVIDLRLLHFNVWPQLVPLFASVYSGRWFGFGRTITLAGPAAVWAGLRVRVANMLRTGAAFGRLWIEDWADPSRASEARYLQQHVAFRRELSAFFVRGFLQRPVGVRVVAGPEAVWVVPAHEVPFNFTVPSVAASAWVRDNGTSLGVMLSNTANASVTVETTIDLARTELDAGAVARWRRERADGGASTPSRSPLLERSSGARAAGAAPALAAERLTFSAPFEPLRSTALRDVTAPLWTHTEMLAEGEAVFLRLAAAR